MSTWSRFRFAPGHREFDCRHEDDVLGGAQTKSGSGEEGNALPTDYDVVVIGGGPGGYVAAIRASQLGLKTAVVERDEVGGVCLNWGCIPSKALLRNAEVVNLVRNASDYGISVKNASYDMGAAIDRSRQVVDRMVKGVHFLFKKNKIDLVNGSARLTGPNAVAVEPGGEELQAKAIIVATGARARDLPMLAADGEHVITSREALELREVPKSIAIVGAGPVGMEFAYFYNSYGAEVTVIEVLDRCVPTEDSELSQALAREFKKLGVSIKTGVGVESAERVNGHVRLALGQAGEGGTVEVDKVLLGVGITPNTEGLGLEEAGVKLTRGGWIDIDGQMRTNLPNLYAIGDVTGKMALAHVAQHMGVIAAEAIAGEETEALVYEDMPRATYCQPQVASFGLTEEQAKERGHEVRVGKFPFTANGKAVATGATAGFVKIVADAKHGEVLGAHMIGHDVTEMLPEISMVKMLEGTSHELGRTVHAHPSMSEAVMEAGLGTLGSSIHI